MDAAPHLADALAAAAERLPPERIDQCWLLAPRELGGRESGVAVLVLLPGDGDAPGVRRLWTLRYELRPGEKRTDPPSRTDALEEQGAAPADRLGGMVEGLVRRLDRLEAGEGPEVREVGGDPARWVALLADLRGDG